MSIDELIQEIETELSNKKPKTYKAMNNKRFMAEYEQAEKMATIKLINFQGDSIDVMHFVRLGLSKYAKFYLTKRIEFLNFNGRNEEISELQGFYLII